MRIGFNRNIIATSLVVGLSAIMLSVGGCGEATKPPFDLVVGLRYPQRSTGLSRGFHVINLSDMDLTNVRITVNGTHTKRTVLATLGGKSNMEKHSGVFVHFSMCLDESGNKMERQDEGGVDSVRIECDQGVWEGGLTPDSVFQKHLAEYKPRGVAPSEPKEGSK